MMIIENESWRFAMVKTSVWRMEKERHGNLKKYILL